MRKSIPTQRQVEVMRVIHSQAPEGVRALGRELAMSPAGALSSLRVLEGKGLAKRVRGRLVLTPRGLDWLEVMA